MTGVPSSVIPGMIDMTRSGGVTSLGISSLDVIYSSIFLSEHEFFPYGPRHSSGHGIKS
jgi:hypothetical protein